MTKILCPICLFICFACISQEKVNDDSIFILKGQLYFLNEHFELQKNDTSERLIWYSNILEDFDEPVLYNSESEKIIYRFLRFGSIIRIEKDSNSCKLYIKNNEGEKIQEISNEQWNRLNNKIKRSNYWQMKPIIERNGKDGYNWILEGKVGGDYKVVDRWVPKKSRYRKLCEYIIELSMTKDVI